MDLQQLTELVTSEAKKEATLLLDNAEKQQEELLFSEKQLIETQQNDKIREENDQFTSKLNYLRFNLESEYKKKVLHLKYDIMETLKAELLKILLEAIQQKPMQYLEHILQERPLDKARFFISSCFEGIINTDHVKLFNDQYSTAFSWGGVDASIEPGIGIEQGTVRYIYPLQELISEFLERHQTEINEQFYA